MGWCGENCPESLHAFVVWVLSGSFNQKTFTAIISFSAGRKQCQLEGVKIKMLASH